MAMRHDDNDIAGDGLRCLFCGSVHEAWGHDPAMAGGDDELAVLLAHARRMSEPDRSD